MCLVGSLKRLLNKFLSTAPESSQANTNYDCDRIRRVERTGALTLSIPNGSVKTCWKPQSNVTFTVKP